MMRYENPILRGFHPDPRICRVGRDFYLWSAPLRSFPARNASQPDLLRGIA